MINILIRTSGRPKYFKQCIESIEQQRYSDYRIIVCNDNNDSYCKPYDPIAVKYRAQTNVFIEGARHFPFNDYLNTLLAEVKSGWVMILDDDDQFKDKYSLEKIAHSLRNKKQVAFWRVDIAGYIVPSAANFRKRPVKKDISGIGFCFHSQYIPLIHIMPWKQADYRLADSLFSWCDSIWIDDILTETQNKEREGNGERKDK